ncbi:DNA cytosine methyltransferase [Streptomyces scabiei]|uniref:DNA cytosine methyltransferase n=1 Tax=Streptomyces scabiei TaxID=1930 RepID=UPI001B30C0D5|nr:MULTISPECIES: DNA cytosine methyltransferase [Streptomyces]MBP5876035.1 DNA cytosine methyltransferase [Streptomyces sp. LBUM 1477]MBP5883765.1 DNA cytosine methyltransferase [Streptomyces sp. LBUM 1487]MDX2629019.1 DNA cytosine methyltransferase [Streptomyces scabiei]MDX3168006.1 DNA cytosine methyltransferase [Streptomyces scabiei]QTU46271.1 DNA cytosine methyltransferase [Streptomyces sp. LBUM 1482]
MYNLRPLDPEPITVVDLFSGCGGFTQGFHEFRPEGAEGSAPVFHSIAAVEHNAAAVATYAANFGSARPDKTVPQAVVHFGDIEKWEPTAEALRADVVIGGPPCQGFSALNRAKKGSDRNRLWEEYVRIVAKIRPKVFVIENVDRFLKSDEFRHLLSQVEGDGLLADYELVTPPGHEPTDTDEQKNKRYLLNSANYGAVQARRRAIVIGVLRDADNSRRMAYPSTSHVRRPKRKHSADLPDQPLAGIDTGTTYWQAVKSVFDESAQLELSGTELPDRKDHISEVDAVVPGIFTTRDLHFGRNPEPLSRARYRAIPEGGNRKNLRDKWYTVDDFGEIHIFGTPTPAGVRTKVDYLSTTSWDNHNTGTGDVMGRLRRDDPSVTIRTEFFKPEKGRYLHPDEPRPITHYEAARIQGFPINFRWCGSKTEIATQIGNAVPIPLGKAIAKAIHAYLRG